MRGWSEYTLEQLGEFKNGVNFSSDKMGQGIALVNVKDITDSPLLHPERMARVDLDLSSKSGESYYAKAGDIFFVRSSVKRDGVGAVGMLKNNSIPVIHCGFVIRFRASSKDVFPRFLFYLLSNPFYREKVRGLSGGATIVNISQESLKTLKVTLPSIPAQQKMATILSAYDDLIECNLRRIGLLKELSQRTYEEWFVKFRVNGKLLRVDQKTGLPEGWRKVKLSEVALINAKSIKKGFEGRIKYVDISSVSTGRIDFFTEYDIADAPGRARRILSHGDIIWSCVRPNRKSYSIVWNPEDNLIASTGFAVITPVDLPASYLHLFLSTDAFVGYLSNRASGAAYPAVTSEVFENAEVIIPTQALVKLFDQKFKSCIDLISNMTKQNKLLKESRDILLPRLMSGEIDVDNVQESLAMAAEPTAKYKKA